jgi:CRISPR-associated protein Cas6
MEQQTPVVGLAAVDLAFRVRGGPIPADHGYPLYSAVSRHLPWLHGDESVGIHPIRGQLTGQRQLALTRESRLVVRLPASKIPEAIHLAGRKLDLEGASLLVGVPTVFPLRPRPTLTSRLVIIKGFLEPGDFLDAARRQLAERGIDGVASLAQRRRAASLEGGAGGQGLAVRRTLRVHDREVVGFAVRVGELSPEDSLNLQAVGMGGRRRFGCGIFVPAAEPAK